MIKRLFFALAVVLMTATAVAQTEMGKSCDNPIPVDKNYEGRVEGPCTLWYSATTYDLPLNVHFIPDVESANPSKNRPDVVVDLTCIPGVYADSKIDSIVRLADGFGVEFPVELRCDLQVNPVTNKSEYDLFLDEMYREQLAEFGVTYNVQAYVQVTFYEAGTVTLKPDTLFSSCMDNTEHVVLDDSISITPNDSDRVFMMPYTDWQNDSIQFVWTGSEPAYIYMAETKCEFAPEISNHYVWALYTVQSGESFRVSNKAINDAILDYSGGGLFYSKVLSASAGKLVVEKIPMKQAEGGAILLEYGKPVQLAANDTNALFCFPKTWTATEFVSSSSSPITMYASNVVEFTTQVNDVNLLAYYDYSLVGAERELELSSRDMKTLTNKAIDEYIYVRFSSKVATTITVYEWDASDCADNSTLIMHGKNMTIAKKTSLVYRLRYDDWKGYDITLNWNGNSSLEVYIAGMCDIELDPDDARLSYAGFINKRSVHVILASDVDSWADKVDSDGYLYVRLYSSNQGGITITSSRPEPTPEPESPCVLNSIELKSGDQIALNLDSAFTIYRINYAEWVAQDRKLSWSGSEALHTFVAETCEFAVAPYNKYVVNYVVVPANGEYVLDVATLTQYADKVDEDGYLYIRFLTEHPGTLTVE